MALQNVEANITLDLYNHDTTPSTVKAIQLDSQTRYVAAMLQNMGAQYDVDSGATVQLIVIRPDKVGVQITGTTFTYGDEGAQFLGPYAELTQVALAVNGKMRGQFKITSGDQILRTEIFTISNGEALDASTDEWADEYDGYNLEEMATSIETNTADIATLEADVSQIKEDFNDMVNSAYVTDSASGSVAHFVDGANDVPLKSLKVNIAPVQSGSGDPSPDNVRPISGWNAVKVTRTGKNLYSRENGDYNVPAFDTNGNSQSYPDVNVVWIKVKPNTAYTTTLIHNSSQAAYARWIECDEYKNFIWRDPNMNSDSFLTRTRTTRSNTRWVQIACNQYPTAQISKNAWEIMFTEGSIATPYEPYNGVNVSIDLGQTVYGGTLDVVSGVLRVTWKCFDGGDVIWTKVDSSYKYGTFSVNTSPLSTYCITIPSVKSSAYKSESNESSSPSADNYVWIRAISTSVRRIYVKDTSKASMTAEEFRTAMTGVQFVYELAEPIEIQLAPTEVKSLLGINNVWSDAGDVDVEYRADTKLYIDKRLAEVTA